ncbi:uncharacterized protein BDZ99DRAFT_408512 [Mytilinidion resinicola]|uniref:PHD-type domain-containing protein n=1 Tax=Mytilinidion resinicola TaxID=574789 RepID=A0A6A6Z2Q6_9PEZI|nr:uncharacterized protein BDZ99DRAFT_408512 [Mytilinidion resinicola]KAF2814963.1 hypothetical protein BDZ99DRAFT_408512 [Mytilinidion resinicola]
MSVSQPPAPPVGPNPTADSIAAVPSATTTQAPAKQTDTNVASIPAKPWQSSMQHGSHNSPTGPAFHQFSASTEEIIKRVSANASARAGTPGYQAAREQVLQKIVTSDKFPTPSPISGASKRGRGGAKSGTPTGFKSDVGASSATPQPMSTPVSGRGRGGGRGRGRGGGRGGKRKRADSDDSENDSDISSSYTPLPTQTKSGRNVNKPTQFVPTLPSPSTGTKRRRPNKKSAEAALCKVCHRGTSPTNNMIVFCDGCNTAYHQYCHDPPIEMEVVQITEKEWLCSPCTRSKQSAVEGMDGLVAGEYLTLEEKRTYLRTLTPSALVSLLLHSNIIHPTLPIFAPDARSIIENSTQAQSNAIHTGLSPQGVNGHQSTIGKSRPTGTPGLSTTNENSDLDPAEAQLQAESQPLVRVPVAQEVEPEPYDGYDTDPPAHYPKAGNGLARTMRPESEDLQWLVDDNFEVFNHNWKGENETGAASGGLQASNGVEGTGVAPSVGAGAKVANNGSQ